LIMRTILAIGAVLPPGVTAAQAQQSVTVKSLLAQKFAVVGTITNVAGWGRPSTKEG
jgi:hypothetical protein